MNIYGVGETCARAVDEVTAAIKIRPLCMEIKRDEDYPVGCDGGLKKNCTVREVN